MQNNNYVRFAVPYSEIEKVLNNSGRKNINFFIDFQSICKGLYNKNNIFYEINYYITNGHPSDTLIDEYREFLNNLWRRFYHYNPYFVTFYDDGKNSQNTAIATGYKGGRSSLSSIITDDKELMMYYQIKDRYFQLVEERFHKEDVGYVYYLHEYESDLIPYYCIYNQFFRSEDNSTLNVVLSNDKDLLQCCQFRNTIQCTNKYYPTRDNNKRFEISLWDDVNAIQYMYSKYKQGSLTSKYISLILALAGDTADGIHGIKGVGYKRAIEMIQDFNLPPTLYELTANHTSLPKKIKDNYDLVITNFKLIDFYEQIKRTKKLK